MTILTVSPKPPLFARLFSVATLIIWVSIAQKWFGAQAAHPVIPARLRERNAVAAKYGCFAATLLWFPLHIVQSPPKQMCER
jgi:hypothetical protein